MASREVGRLESTNLQNHFQILEQLCQNQSGNGEGYSSQDMDLEIQRVARELYKAFSGLNEEFERPQDQVGE